MTLKNYDTPLGTLRYWVSRCGEDRPWLIFLPGLTADHTLFDGQMEGLRGKFNCLTWDPPAHGASRPFQLEFTMEDMADYLRGILAAEEIERPILVGQSMGGYLSQTYMVRYPGSVGGFVSIDSCSLSRKYYTWLELAMLKHTKWMYLSFPWKLLQKVGPEGCSQTAYGRELMLRMMRSFEKKEYCALADHGYRIVAEAVEAGKDYTLRCPALLLCGEKDAAGSAKRYNIAWNREDGIPLVWVKNAGHNANTDQIGFVNQKIEEFVSACLAREN